VFVFYVLPNSFSRPKHGLVMPVFAPMLTNLPLAPPMPALFQQMEQPLNERVENS
jgi:hypothetical protein